MIQEADTIIEYVEDIGRYTFEEKPFSQVDSLILTQLCYAQMEGLAPEPREASHGWNWLIGKKRGIRLIDVLDGIQDQSHFFSEFFNLEGLKRLFLACVCSPRYRQMRLHSHMDILDEHAEIQFSATCFSLENGDTYIGFRGTDTSFIGWKEDFNMSFMDVVPSQLAAVEYVKTAADTVEGRLRIGGHSKGGNLAVFAAVKSAKALRDRIDAVYNHDGPGFPEAFFESSEFKEVSGRIHTTFPRSAVVGMIMQHQKNYQVVNSSSIGLFQHDGFSWEIKGDDFDYAEDIDINAQANRRIIAKWLTDVGPEERQRLINLLYEIVRSSNVSTIEELKKNWLECSRAIFRYTMGMDEETEHFIRDTLALMASAAVKETFAWPKEQGKGKKKLTIEKNLLK